MALARAQSPKVQLEPAALPPIDSWITHSHGALWLECFDVLPGPIPTLLLREVLEREVHRPAASGGDDPPASAGARLFRRSGARKNPTEAPFLPAFA